MKRIPLPLLAAALVLSACSDPQPLTTADLDEDPAEVAVGERLFLETRFAQYFAVHAGEINSPLAAGDPAVATLRDATGIDRPGPMAGQSMNCRQCHLVDESLDDGGGSMRTYNDFARRTPIPDRSDGGDYGTLTLRNAPPLVNASLPRPDGMLFHFDGEFPSLEDLVTGTLTGRNYGWLPDESSAAIAHIARVIREDDGHGALALEFGGSYRRVLAGSDPALPVTMQLPPAYRIDVDSASDKQIVDAVARLVAAYVRQLEFSRDADGHFNGSPYDLFLKLNGLPARPDEGEAAIDYGRRLRTAIDALRAPVFVPADTRSFRFHPGQRFVFGPVELSGLRLFLTEAAGAQSRAANCVACHAPPAFTDFGVHNTGATQEEYDSVHGSGTFMSLAIPDLAARNAGPQHWLPATPSHPDYAGMARAIPVAGAPDASDLGAWSVFANPDFPNSQDSLRQALCRIDNAALCPADAGLLDRAIATFKTPGLRDLGHSAPYMHSGRLDTLDAVITFYLQQAELARQGLLRNADPALARISLTAADVEPLVRFLQSLNEDYE